MCRAPFDAAYAAYGGVVERGDLYQGRVASRFDPAASQVLHAADGPGHVIPQELATQPSVVVRDEQVVEPPSAFEPGTAFQPSLSTDDGEHQ